MRMRLTTFAALAITAMAAFSSCGNGFPAIRQKGKTAIVAHRGAWNYEQAGFSQNSIASLAYAQELGLWGSEFDIHLTADDKVLVFHDNKIGKVRIDTVNASVWADYRLPNGESIPTLDEYLTQGEKSSSTVLVCELKKHFYPEREPRLVELTVEAFKAHGLFDPKRVIFISFSKQMCDIIAKQYPRFINQYLEGDLSPEALEADRINGWDYEQKVVSAHPEWVKDARKRGMSSNVWTVNKEAKMREYIGGGIDAITTNEPIALREILGDKEFKLK